MALNEPNDGFACLEGRRVLLMEARPNADSPNIQARAAWCLTAPTNDEKYLLQLMQDTDIEVVVLNDVLANTISITPLLCQINYRLRPGGCLMICEPFWAIDPFHESARIQALIHLRDHTHHRQYPPIWQRGQLYSLMQGLGLNDIIFEPTAFDNMDPPGHPFPAIFDQLPASSLIHIQTGRMRMWGHKPNRAR